MTASGGGAKAPSPSADDLVSDILYMFGNRCECEEDAEVVLHEAKAEVLRSVSPRLAAETLLLLAEL